MEVLFFNLSLNLQFPELRTSGTELPSRLHKWLISARLLYY